MIFKTVRSDGLAHLSYFIADENAGEAVVIDPRRDIGIYLDIAAEESVKIKYITETHVHADFVSGTKELAEITGGTALLPAGGGYEFGHERLNEGDEINIGELTLKVFETPGHTPEHISLLIRGGSGSEAPWGLFTGDTLFSGDIGRPDLLGENVEKQLASNLYDSLFNKIIPFGDEIIVYPAHGKGSPCGASIGERDVTTIGYEKRFSDILQIKEKEKFVNEILNKQSKPPGYYSRMKKVNIKGPDSLRGINTPEPLTADEFEEKMNNGNTLVLDTREINSFGGAHIPGSLNIGLRKSFPVWAGRVLDEEFPVWAGWIIDPDFEILIVPEDDGDLPEITTQLARLGYDNIGGYLRNGIRTWIDSGKNFDRQVQLSVHELKEKLDADKNILLLDVRKPEEYEAGRLPKAKNIYVPDLLDKYENEINKGSPVAVYCGSGYRASIAASYLKNKGVEKVYNIPGSFSAWMGAGYEIEK